MERILKFNTPAIIPEPENLMIGDHTIILKNARLQTYSKLVQDKDNAKIIIGNNCYIGSNISILAGAKVQIGNNVLIASNVLITSENHGIDPESEISYMNQQLVIKPVVIKDGSWIGEKVCIMPGVIIGIKSIVGAGSIVTKSIPDYSIAAGNPAVILKQYNFITHQWEKYEKEKI